MRGDMKETAVVGVAVGELVRGDALHPGKRINKTRKVPMDKQSPNILVEEIWKDKF